MASSPLRSQARSQPPRESARSQPLAGRFFTVRLSFLGLMGVGLASLIAFAWVFAFGVIVGRGFEPEQKLPMLGRLAEKTPLSEEEENPEVIRAEDLTFFSDLRTQPRLSTEEPEQAPQRRAITIPPPPAVETDPLRTGTQQQPLIESGQQQRVASRSTPQQPSQAMPRAVPETSTAAVEMNRENSQRYNFVFQVIAYKKAEQADAFRDKLEDAGLRTRLQVERDAQGKPRFYRIQVLARGTDADAEDVKSVLARHGVKDPILSSRSPI